MQTETLYIRNVSDNNKRMVYTNFLDSAAQNILKQHCSVKMSTNVNTGKRKYFVYVTTPQRVHSELIKLNGTQFKSTYIIVEEAKK